MARQGPHQVAQKSTSTGLSAFKTSASKFASVTSTIPLPAIFFLLVVNAALSADAPASWRCRALAINAPLFGSLLSYHLHSMREHAGRSQRPRIPTKALSWQRFQESDQLPALGLRQTAPGRHAVFLASIGQQPK